MQVVNDQFSNGNGDLGIPHFKQPHIPEFPKNSSWLSDAKCPCRTWLRFHGIQHE